MIETQYPFLKEYISKLFSSEHLLSNAIVGVFLSPILYFTQTYVFGDATFIILFLVAFTMDIITGALNHFIKVGDFSFTQLGMKAMIKFIACIATLITFHVVSSAINNGDAVTTFASVYLFVLGKTITIVFIGGSVFENIYSLTDKKFPPIGWLNRIRKYNVTMNTSDLLESEKTENKKV